MRTVILSLLTFLTMNDNPNQTESASQGAVILKHLQEVGPIRPLEALRRYGCMRLGARIWELKEAGHDIRRELVLTEGGVRVAEYTWHAPKADPAECGVPAVSDVDRDAISPQTSSN